MNEFVAKKIGEIMAFCRIGEETLERGKEALGQMLPEEEVEKIASNMRTQFEELQALAPEQFVEVTNKKIEGTSEKLRSMRDSYIGDEWDNPAEVLEWLGFFEGAAIVHFALVAAASEKLAMGDLNQTVLKGLAFHEARLNEVKEMIEDIARKRV